MLNVPDLFALISANQDFVVNLTVGRSTIKSCNLFVDRVILTLQPSKFGVKVN
jgi:hypothetical protein